MSFGDPPVYPFTYTVLSSTMTRVNVFNGNAAYQASGGNNIVQGTTETSTNIVTNERDNIMTDYVANTVGPYLLPQTLITIDGTMDISPISSGNYYRFGDVSTPITITFVGSQSDVFYIYKSTTDSQTLDLSFVTFVLDGANVANIYIIYNQSLILPSTMYGNLIMLGGNVTINNDATLYGTLSVYGNALFESTGTLTVQSPTPSYTFTYSAIADTLNNVNIVGGLVGYSETTVNVASSPNSPTTTVGNEPLFITSFTNFITGAYLQGLTSKSIVGDVTISPGVCYTIAPISAITITIPLTSADNLFFIYSVSDLDLTAVTFIMNGDTTANIYIISDGNIIAAPLMYGNIICNNLVVTSETTLYGTASCEGTLGSDTYRLNVNFQSDISCFLRGTKILTDQWYVPVEELKEGDTVITRGKICDNKGHTVDADTPMQITHIHKQICSAGFKTSPIVITKNAFGVNKPFEDLYVSKNHGLINRKGTMHSANKYVNGVSIYQDPTIDRVTYYHIELASHCVIIANGVAVESYLAP
jgi:hypothetical protein